MTVMPHFLIKKEEIKNDFIELSDNDNFFHLTRVLRIKTGETIKFIDNEQNVYESKVAQINKNNLQAEIIKKYKTNRILKNNIVLIQSILANDAQNFAIANATQTGAKEIYPVISDNVANINNSSFKKVEKWQKIALENFKQCERGDMIKVNEVLKLKDVLKKFKKENTLIFAEKYENSNLEDSLKNLIKGEPIAIVIGPEGGFSENEFEYFKKENYKLITLGKMIYKAPNAITAGISNVVSRLEKNV